MHLFYIPQCTIQNINVHISVMNGVLWDMEQVHYGNCEISVLLHQAIFNPCNAESILGNMEYICLDTL